jgi:hypothetical protein
MSEDGITFLSYHFLGIRLYQLLLLRSIGVIVVEQVNREPATDGTVPVLGLEHMGTVLVRLLI